MSAITAEAALGGGSVWVKSDSDPVQAEFILFLSDFQRHIYQEQVRLSKFLEMATMLHRRYRALTTSDLVSRWGTQRGTEGQWLEYDPNEDGEVHPINIIQPAIRANVSACLQSHPQIEISSTNQSADSKRTATRWKQINDYFYRKQWSENRRGIVFDAIQKDGTILIHSYPRKSGRIRVEKQGLFSCPRCGATGARGNIEYKSGDGVSGVAAFGKEAFGDGGQVFDLGNADGMDEKVRQRERVGDGDYYQGGTPPIEGGANKGKERTSRIDDSNNPKNALEDLAAEFSTVSCPECGFEQATAFIGGQELPEYEIESRILPLFHFTIDRLGTKLDGIQGAYWVQVQTPVHRARLEADFPHLNFGGPFPWSRHIQLDYALSSADWRYFNYSQQHYSTVTRFDVFELREIFIHEDAYREYRPNADFEFIGRDGEVRFEIKEGETIAEAYIRRYGYNPGGLYTKWINDQLIDIVPPTETEINFRKCFAEVHWLRDSGSFISSPYYSIVTVQDDITLLNTLYHNIIARNAVNQVYYDSLVFDNADFTKEYVGSKNAHLLPDRKIENAITQLPVPVPSPHLINHLQFLFGIKDTITMATPALKGEAQRGETYSAQRQQLEQSMGLLTPALKSWANALVTIFQQQAALAAKWWTREQFEAVANEFGEKWTEADIEELTSIDFDRDIKIEYAAGSEMPRSQLQRELQFYNGLQQLFALGPDVVMQLVGPEKMTQLLKRIDEFSEFDFDLTGLEVQDLINQKRYIDLTQAAAEYASMSLEEVEAMKLDVRAFDASGMPISMFDTLIEQVIGQTSIRFDQYDDLESVARFFIERMRIETSAERPNYVLIETISSVVRTIELDARNRQLEQSREAVMMQQADGAVQFEKDQALEAAVTEKVIRDG